jgi:uncharacterized membrane protein required for colicin V production
MAMANILVDSTIAVIIFGSLYEGYRKGLMTNLLGLVGFATVLLLCFSFGELLSKPLKPIFPLPPTYATLAAYIVICFAIAIVFYFLQAGLGRFIMKKLPPAVDSIGGLFVGALRGAVFTALCMMILMLMANPVISRKIGHESHIGAAFFKEVSKVSPTVNEIVTSNPSPLTKNRVTKGPSEYEKVVNGFDGKKRQTQ